MTRITITIELLEAGLIIVADPSLEQLLERARLTRQGLNPAEKIAVAAWIAIRHQSEEIGAMQSGHTPDESKH